MESWKRGRESDVEEFSHQMRFSLRSDGWTPNWEYETKDFSMNTRGTINKVSKKEPRDWR